MTRNLYANLDDWERRFSYDVDLAAADRTELEKILDSASRDVDIHCRTHFFAQTRTVILDGSGSKELRVPDLLTVTSIKLDQNRDRVYEDTLVATDYRLLRPNHEFPYDTLPKRLIRLDTQIGQFSVFLAQEELVEIVGEWGFVNNIEDTGDTVQDATEQSDTQLTLSVTAGTNFSVGQTLKLGDEQEYVSGISANILAVARGVNGTAAVVHANASVINRYTYLPEVRDATLIEAVRQWKRKELAFVAREGSLQEGFDVDAARLLQDFVRYDQ